MKPGDLVRLSRCNQPGASEEFETVGLIVCAMALYDTPHFKVMWNVGVILIEDARDLELFDETR
jgi:hypothetical protein